MYIFFTEVEATVGPAPTVKTFDDDTRPTGPVPPEPSDVIRPKATRRRYSHTFSAGRRLKLVRGANGQNRWRIVPDAAIVHYGKQQFTSKKSSVNHYGNFGIDK
jgi:hypothetical protein